MSQIEITPNRIEWRLPDGRLHRDDGPAVEWSSGTKEWWIEGHLHREDGPAVIEATTGRRLWFKHGTIHRVGGPAIEVPGEYGEWYLDGKRHCEIWPALAHRSGLFEFFRHGKRLGPPWYYASRFIEIEEEFNGFI